jgi:hypothetical protein
MVEIPEWGISFAPRRHRNLDSCSNQELDLMYWIQYFLCNARSY